MYMRMPASDYIAVERNRYAAGLSFGKSDHRGRLCRRAKGDFMALTTVDLDQSLADEIRLDGRVAQDFVDVFILNSDRRSGCDFRGLTR